MGRSRKIVCFYWQGDRWQDKGYKANEGHVNLQEKQLARFGTVDNRLASRYVNNLYEGVKRFVSIDFEFICFTNEKLDLQEGIVKRNFEMVSEHGVLPRIYMFSHKAGLMGSQVLCLDLDVVVVGNLRNIIGYEGAFCTRSKFKPGLQHKIDGDIMSFSADEFNEKRFYLDFVENKEEAERITQGRERYWVRHVTESKVDRWENVAPKEVVSYSWHIRRGRGIPDKATIVSCHGYPRPHQIKDKWIKEFWK